MRDKQWMQGEGEGRGSSRSFKSNPFLWVSSGGGRKPHTLFPPKHSRAAGRERSASKEKWNYLPSWAIAAAMVHSRAVKDPRWGR